MRAASAGESALDMWFSSVDADRDGALSQAEFRTEALSFFSRLDANHDQAATSLESTAIYQHEAPEVLAAAMSGPPIMGGPGGRRGPPRGGPGGGGPGGPGGPGGGGPGGPGGGGPGGGGFPGGGPPGGEGGGRGGGPRARMIEPPQGAQLFGLLGDIEPVMSCDTDLSRRVTVDEFNACITARFRELDSNQDGFFQRAEARLWRERAGPPRR